jgi:CheY-like chemotaxis protein
MDCNMPVMDGFQATQEIRKDFDQSQIHIAALTAYASEAFE